MMITKAGLTLASSCLNAKGKDFKDMPALKSSTEYTARLLTQEPDARGNLTVFSHSLTKGKTQCKEIEVHLNANSPFRIDSDGTRAVIACQSGTFGLHKKMTREIIFSRRGMNLPSLKKAAWYCKFFRMGLLKSTKIKST
jgi:hypothetical protein